MIAKAEIPSISGAILSHLPLIAYIEQAAFTNPWNEAMMKAAVMNPEYDVRVLHDPHGLLAGFYIAHRVVHRSNLDNLAVAESCRNNGYGSLLIEDWMIRSARKRLKSLSLQVNVENTRAQKLYQRYRFQITRLMMGYYPNGEDAFEMLRTEPPSGE